MDAVESVPTAPVAASTRCLQKKHEGHLASHLESDHSTEAVAPRSFSYPSPLQAPYP